MELRLGHGVGQAAQGPGIEVGHGPMVGPTAGPARTARVRWVAGARWAIRGSAGCEQWMIASETATAHPERTPMSTILVTGASGFVGSHMVPALVDAGHRVLALVRDDDGARHGHAPPRASPADAVETRVGDVTRSPTPSPPRSRAPTRSSTWSPCPATGTAAPRSAWSTPRGPATSCGPRRTRASAASSTSGALGVVDDPDLHYGSSKVKGMALVRESGLDWTILSPSLLFGPRDGFFNILADLVRMSPGIVPITGKGDARFQPLAITDLAQAAVVTFGRPGDGRQGAPARRTALLDLPRDRRGGPARDGQAAGAGADAGRADPPGGRVAEKVRIPFPVATDQLRQLKHDNIGPVASVVDGFGVRAPADGGRADAPAPEAQGPGAPRDLRPAGLSAWRWPRGPAPPATDPGRPRPDAPRAPVSSATRRLPRDRGPARDPLPSPASRASCGPSRPGSPGSPSRS